MNKKKFRFPQLSFLLFRLLQFLFFSFKISTFINSVPTLSLSHPTQTCQTINQPRYWFSMVCLPAFGCHVILSWLSLGCFHQMWPNWKRDASYFLSTFWTISAVKKLLQYCSLLNQLLHPFATLSNTWHTLLTQTV